MGECGWMVYRGQKGEGGNMGNCKGGGGWVGRGGVSEGYEKEGGARWKCGGVWVGQGGVSKECDEEGEA